MNYTDGAIWMELAHTPLQYLNPLCYMHKDNHKLTNHRKSIIT